MRTSTLFIAFCAIFLALVSITSTSAVAVPTVEALDTREAETAAALERSTEEPENQDLEARATHHGKGTYFYPGLGACGWWSGSNDKIMAISGAAWGGGNKCGRVAKVCHGKKCVKAKVVDMCPGCPRGSLDLSPAAFKKLASLSKGMIDISWHFV